MAQKPRAARNATLKVAARIEPDAEGRLPSKHGSTAEIAEALTSAGVAAAGVDVRQVKEPRALRRRGSGERRLHEALARDARRFLHRHGDEFAARPFWIFSSGPVGDPAEEPDPEWIEPRNAEMKLATSA